MENKQFKLAFGGFLPEHDLSSVNVGLESTFILHISSESEFGKVRSAHDTELHALHNAIHVC